MLPGHHGTSRVFEAMTTAHKVDGDQWRDDEDMRCRGRGVRHARPRIGESVPSRRSKMEPPTFRSGPDATLGPGGRAGDALCLCRLHSVLGMVVDGSRESCLGTSSVLWYMYYQR